MCSFKNLHNIFDCFLPRKSNRPTGCLKSRDNLMVIKLPDEVGTATKKKVNADLSILEMVN
ncbi:Putative protein [Zobellia galactanivorans]|uniref:Uncharacterized protein n=1 Tax=Zobellia galactanivorans (strain DSM 12802 / CCUG 47099 / CIP 106680 / NCIMB 13871 / Dsij) TaxID=63186 RepID=G0L9A2_ZOBGA|nr:Putative protein [Zobellia galactanivorans]